MTIRVANEVGGIIKEYRKKRNLTQQDLSEKIDISRNYISDIECGRYVPSVETLIALANVLKIDLNLLKNDGNTSKIRREKE